MKKVGLLMGLGMASVVSLGAYAFINKKTNKNATELLNNMLEKANDLTK